MIEIKVYMVMGQCCLEVRLSEEAGRSLSAAREYFSLDPSVDPIADLCSHVTKALQTVESYAGDVSGELTFGT